MGFTSYIHSLPEELDNYDYGSSSTFILDVGTGVEVKLEIVTFAPEFIYFHGLTNVNENLTFNGEVLLYNFAVLFSFPFSISTS